MSLALLRFLPNFHHTKKEKEKRFEESLQFCAAEPAWANGKEKRKEQLHQKRNEDKQIILVFSL